MTELLHVGGVGQETDRRQVDRDSATDRTASLGQRVFAEPSVRSPALSAQATPAPFFIVGAQRSGTTMLRLMLNQHSELDVPFESGFIPVFRKKLAQYGDLSKADNARRLLSDIQVYPLVSKGELVADPDEVLAHPIANYSDLVQAIFAAHATRRGKARWGDKTPSYVTELETLWKLFPGCRIIHVVRDGRDVALSNRSTEWGIHSLPRAAEDWRWKTVLAHKIGEVLGPHYEEIRYEDLVLKPKEALRAVCRFLDVPYEERLLDYPKTAEKEMPKESLAWHQKSIKAPDATQVYSWKRRMSLSDRIIFDRIAGDALDTFGYERETHGTTLGVRVKQLYYAVFRRW